MASMTSWGAGASTPSAAPWESCWRVPPHQMSPWIAGLGTDALEGFLSAESEDGGHALPFGMGGLEILDDLLGQLAVSGGIDGEGDGAALASALGAVAAIASALIEAAGGQSHGGAGEYGALQVLASIEHQFLSFEWCVCSRAVSRGSGLDR